jgi:hypothetical protein
LNIINSKESFPLPLQKKDRQDAASAKNVDKNKQASVLVNKTSKDEMIGLWENDLDDGSGLHAIWGWSFLFNEDGSGTYYYWSEQKLQWETPFSWRRIQPGIIQAKYEDDEDWTTIEYSLAIVNAPYSGKLLKLTDNNYVPGDLSDVGFWNSYGALFKEIH